jgi:hypothetical protein
LQFGLATSCHSVCVGGMCCQEARRGPGVGVKGPAPVQFDTGFVLSGCVGHTPESGLLMRCPRKQMVFFGRKSWSLFLVLSSQTTCQSCVVHRCVSGSFSLASTNWLVVLVLVPAGLYYLLPSSTAIAASQPSFTLRHSHAPTAHPQATNACGRVPSPACQSPWHLRAPSPF